jgi:transposase
MLPWLLEGPIDGESFQTCVEKVLLPTLRPGDIVIKDNLGSHKRKVDRRLIHSVGARLIFLPKYSPDLNPIEQVLAKLKHLLRKAAARTVEAVCAAIGQLLRTFAPTNAQPTSRMQARHYAKSITLIDAVIRSESRILGSPLRTRRIRQARNSHRRC